MEAIVLAGGFGTRLRQVLVDAPKPMALVAGRPFLEYVLGALASKGVTRTILSVGYMAEKIRSHFGSAFQDMALDYCVEDSPLGTGGAVASALLRCHEDPVLVLNGDTYLDLEVGPMLAHWQRERHPIIVARQVDDVARYGQLQVQDGQVTRFAEKGGIGPGLINAGVYLVPRNLFAGHALVPPFSIETDFLAHYVRARRTDVFVTHGEFIDIGVPEDLHRAQAMHLGRPH